MAKCAEVTKRTMQLRSAPETTEAHCHRRTLTLSFARGCCRVSRHAAEWTSEIPFFVGRQRVGKGGPPGRTAALPDRPERVLAVRAVVMARAVHLSPAMKARAVELLWVRDDCVAMDSHVYRLHR
jgi:hypothetical protein